MSPAFKPLPADRPLRYGFVGLGKIAHTLAQDLPLVPDEGVLWAVGSRTQAKADEFARQYGAAKAYGSYEELVADPDVDVVYVATPHAQHLEPSLAALRNGKHVLVEKALTISPADTRALIQEASERGLFLMEAVWARTNPLLRKAHEMVSQGVLGEIRHIDARLGLNTDFPDEDRMVAPELGGGAIWDLGVYPAHFTNLFLGAPDTIVASGNAGRTGVDYHAVAHLTHEREGQPAIIADLMASFDVYAHGYAVYGTLGTLRFNKIFAPTEIVLERGDFPNAPKTERFVTEVPGNGYTFQYQEVARCLRSGLQESPLVPWVDTIAVADLLEEWRVAALGGNA